MKLFFPGEMNAYKQILIYLNAFFIEEWKTLCLHSKSIFRDDTRTLMKYQWAMINDQKSMITDQWSLS